MLIPSSIFNKSSYTKNPMIPASYASTLPFGQNIDPFVIYFVIPKKEYKKNRGWLERLNKDNELTSGIFKIKVYPKELLTASAEGDHVLKLMQYSNVMARALNTEPHFIRVEHQFIDIKEGDTIGFRQSLYLFLLQLCRADLDIVKEMIYFPSRKVQRDSENFGVKESLEKTEKFFNGLVNYYAKLIDQSDQIRLRPYKYLRRPYQIKKNNDFHNRLEESSPFLSFQVSSSFPGYVAAEDKEEMLEGIAISQNEDGTLKINPEDFKRILIKGGLIKSVTEDDRDPWIQPEKIRINVIEGSGEIRAERFPHLEIVIGGNQVHDIRLKSIEGSILYLATLLKHKYGFPLKREEIIGIFKNIPKKYSNEINRDNIEEYISDENFPAYEWVKEIYKSIYGEASFNQWCYERYTNTVGCSRPFQTGLHQLKEHIRISMNNSGNNLYTPFVNICSNQETKKADKDSKKDNKKSKKRQTESEKNQDDRFIEYSIKTPSSNINFSDAFRKLEEATIVYLESLGFKITE